MFRTLKVQIGTALAMTVEAFQRVAQGDLTHQIEVNNTEDLEKLTQSFNRLTGRLHSLFSLTDRHVKNGCITTTYGGRAYLFQRRTNIERR